MPISVKDGKATYSLDVGAAQRSGASQTEASCQARSNGGSTYYEFEAWYDGYDWFWRPAILKKFIGGVPTVLGSFTPSSSVFSIECIGTTIRVYEGATVRLSLTDSSITTAGDWRLVDTGFAFGFSLVSYDSTGGVLSPLFGSGVINAPTVVRGF